MSDLIFNPNQLVWVERYRPLRVEDCILPDRIKRNLLTYVETGDFPSLMFVGGAGTGKTTAAKAMTSQLGMDTIVINVSKNRGMDILRTEIDSFATSVSMDGGVKCIILDEFDGATELLQKALRAAIEDYAINCRFIITCNYPNKIIEPIHSRTAKIDMKIRKDEIAPLCTAFLKRMEQILKLENVEFERKAIAKLIQSNFPDFRSIINTIQHLSAGGKIDLETIDAYNSDISLTKLAKAWKEKDFKSMRQWVANNSNSDPNILFPKIYESLDEIIHPSSIPEVILILNEHMHIAATAIDPEINLAALCTNIMATATFN